MNAHGLRKCNHGTSKYTPPPLGLLTCHLAADEHFWWIFESEYSCFEYKAQNLYTLLWNCSHPTTLIVYEEIGPETWALSCANWNLMQTIFFTSNNNSLLITVLLDTTQFLYCNYQHRDIIRCSTLQWTPNDLSAWCVGSCVACCYRSSWTNPELYLHRYHTLRWYCCPPVHSNSRSWLIHTLSTQSNRIGAKVESCKTNKVVNLLTICTSTYKVKNCWTRPLEQPFLFGTHSNCREAEQLCKMQINYLVSYNLVHQIMSIFTWPDYWNNFFVLLETNCTLNGKKMVTWIQVAWT